MSDKEKNQCRIEIYDAENSLMMASYSTDSFEKVESMMRDIFSALSNACEISVVNGKLFFHKTVLLAGHVAIFKVEYD